MSTYAQVKLRLLSAAAAATAKHGEQAVVEGFVDAIERFPKCAEEVPAYRDSLKRLAPEMRKPLEDALSWVTET